MNSVCVPTSRFPYRATISPRALRESRPAIAISVRSFAIAPMRPQNFLQAGIELFGRSDKAAADAEMLSLGLEATAHYGVVSPDIQIGDVSLFAGLVAGLDLPPAWKRRLIKDFNRKTNLAQDLDRLVLGGNNARPEYQGVLAALAGSDPKGAHALITDLLSIAGINAVGGRSVGEIAGRFLEQSALGVSAKLPRDVRDLIERFLAIRGQSRRGRRYAARARERRQNDAARLRLLSTSSRVGPDFWKHVASMSSVCAFRQRSDVASTTTPVWSLN